MRLDDSLQAPPNDRRSVVRRAAASDADTLLPLIRAHAHHEGSAVHVSSSALQAALAGRTPLLRAWLAEAAGEPLGYATATLDFSTWSGSSFLHLDCLFVRASHRGRGVGALLMAAARTCAASIGVGEMQWQTPAWNESARRFYLREGAICVPKMRFICAISRNEPR